MNRQILKPQVDVPLVILLDKGPDGKETTNQQGKTEYQYTVNDDSCVMWLPPEARAQLLRTGAQAGDTVQLVKSLRGKNAFWNAQVLPDSAEPPPLRTPARVAANATRLLAPRPSYPPTNAQAGAARHLAQQIPRDPQDPLPEPPPAAAPETHPMEQILTRCLELAARAQWNAYRTAQAEGIAIEGPNWEDVRAAGISLFIERARNGGSR
jgi:hypothetical protein